VKAVDSSITSATSVCEVPQVGRLRGHKRSIARMALGAAGVVFGDIGTSPLYAIQTTFGAHHLPVDNTNVFGVLSLMFWSLIMVVSVKYGYFILRADNKGEGGIMALMALAQRCVADNKRTLWLVMVLGLFGTSLFFGDSVITPAISVLSAVEGLKVAAPGLAHVVIPITIVVLIGLFVIQSRGTALVGALFGPVMVVWFVAIAVLGVHEILQAPQVLAAMNPWYAVKFFVHNGWLGFFALASIVLAITGAEALYADLGHFGRFPIRLAWYGFALPSLLLNYIGQGALMLSNPKTVSDPFYLMVPAWLLYPMIALATAATVIASQAVISGAFSIARESIQLGFLPRMRILHTSKKTQGQIYLPAVNRMLLVLIVAVVLGFQTSDNLASAYGIAVVSTMVSTTVLMLIVIRRMWHWNWLQVAAFGLVFLTIDLSFFVSGLTKIVHGGWFPLALGICVFTLMSTWKRGRGLVRSSIEEQSLVLQPFLDSLALSPPHKVPGVAVFLTAHTHHVPHALLHNLKHNKVLHARNVILTIETLDAAYADPGERSELSNLGNDFYQLRLKYGFAEEPNVPETLMSCAFSGLHFDMMETTFFSSRESLVAAEHAGMPLWRDKLFAFMARNSTPASDFFRIPGNRLVELGTRVEI
jgi:KUP system potassium uptake protein